MTIAQHVLHAQMGCLHLITTVSQHVRARIMGTVHLAVVKVFKKISTFSSCSYLFFKVCKADCTDCTDASTCIACTNGKYASNNSCVINCPTAEYGDANCGRCIGMYIVVQRDLIINTDNRFDSLS